MARGHGEAALSINVLVEELIDPASREWVPYVRCLVRSYGQFGRRFRV